LIGVALINSRPRANAGKHGEIGVFVKYRRTEHAVVMVHSRAKFSSM
jgi:hypothetical protein